MIYLFFFFNDTATTEIYTLSLHDALPIWEHERDDARGDADESLEEQRPPRLVVAAASDGGDDVEDALDERIAAEEQDQDGERDSWQDDRQDAEDDRGDTAKRHSPPVLRKRVDAHVSVSSTRRLRRSPESTRSSCALVVCATLASRIQADLHRHVELGIVSLDVRRAVFRSEFIGNLPYFTRVRDSLRFRGELRSAGGDGHGRGPRDVLVPVTVRAFDG